MREDVGLAGAPQGGCPGTPARASRGACGRRGGAGPTAAAFYKSSQTRKVVLASRREGSQMGIKRLVWVLPAG